MKSKSFVSFVILVIGALLLVACQTTNAASQPPPPDDSPIRIGISLAFVGQRAVTGTAAGQGYEVWAAMINEAGGLLGRPVELIVVDNESDRDKAAADYEKLISEDKVDLVLGTTSSFLVIPTSEVAAKHGYAYIEPGGGAPEVFNRGLNNLFFVQPAQSARQADPFALYILGLPPEERPKTFAVVASEDDFTLSVANRLESLLSDGGLEMVVKITHPLETMDFSEIAAQIAELNPDLLVGSDQFDSTLEQVRAYQSAGYQPRFVYFTTAPSVPEPFREGLGPATEGIFSSVSWFPEARSFQNAEFVAKYIEMFGGTLADIPEDAANAFTAGQVLQQAVEKIGSIDNATLIEELHQGSYDTVVGQLSFDEVGAPQGSFMLLQWQNDSFVIVGPADRAETDPLSPPKPEW